MNLNRISYRSRQFWHALTAIPAAEDLIQIRQILAPGEFALFKMLQPAEQVHALNVFQILVRSGVNSPDLLKSALLHDVGKTRIHLHLWERILIVLARKFIPRAVQRWGQGEARGWRRPFVVAEQHANWGAEMSVRAGSPPLTVVLIRRHQDSPPDPPISIEDQLLLQLQAADDAS
jgi:hypothetical protein